MVGSIQDALAAAIPASALQPPPDAKQDSAAPKPPQKDALASVENDPELKAAKEKLAKDEKATPVFPTVENGMLESPPKPDTSNDPMKGYVSAIGVLGAIGSMFTRTPMIHSMNAAAGVINAMNASDDKAFKQKFEEWKVHNDTAFKLLDYQQAIYKNILDNDKFSVTEKKGELVAAAAMFKEERMLDIAQRGDMREAAKTVSEVGEAKLKAQELSYKIQAMGEAKAVLDEDFAAGKITKEQRAEKMLEVVNPSRARAARPTALETKRAEDVQELADVREDVKSVLDSITKDPALIGTKGIVRRGYQAVAGQTADELAQDTESESVKQNLIGIKARIGKIVMNTRYFSGPAQKAVEQLLPGLEAQDDPGKVKAALQNIDHILEEKQREKGGSQEAEGKEGKTYQDAVDMLKANPYLREDFDAQFGAGSAARELGN